MQITNTDGLSVWDIQRKKRHHLSGMHDYESLFPVLRDYWIEFTECDQCGRVDYCKYTQARPHLPERHKDIRCGVATTALKSFLQYTFEEFLNGSNEQKQSYIDGAFFFTRFVFESEVRTAIFLDDACMRFWDRLAPVAVSQLTMLRNNLDYMVKALLPIPAFNAKQAIVLVEGQSEQVFLERMRRTQSFSFLHLDVQSYGGVGNRQPKRIQMLLNHFSENGYTVYLQGDADGKSDRPFQALCSKTGLPEDRTFHFDYDFETSVPHELLYAVLNRLGLLEEAQKEEDFVRRIVGDGSVAERLKTAFNIDISPFKTEFALVLADVVRLGPWWDRSSDFMDSELGRFLDFCSRAVP